MPDFYGYDFQSITDCYETDTTKYRFPGFAGTISRGGNSLSSDRISDGQAKWNLNMLFGIFQDQPGGLLTHHLKIG